MKRREFLQASGVIAANSIVGGSLLSIRKAEADTGLPIAALKAELDPQKDLVLIAGSTTPNKFDYNASFSKRKQVTPQVRVVASSPQAVGSTIRLPSPSGWYCRRPACRGVKPAGRRQYHPLGDGKRRELCHSLGRSFL